MKNRTRLGSKNAPKDRGVFILWQIEGFTPNA